MCPLQCSGGFVDSIVLLLLAENASWHPAKGEVQFVQHVTETNQQGT